MRLRRGNLKGLRGARWLKVSDICHIIMFFQYRGLIIHGSNKQPLEKNKSVNLPVMQTAVLILKQAPDNRREEEVVLMSYESSVLHFHVNPDYRVQCYFNNNLQIKPFSPTLSARLLFYSWKPEHTKMSHYFFMYICRANEIIPPPNLSTSPFHRREGNNHQGGKRVIEAQRSIHNSAALSASLEMQFTELTEERTLSERQNERDLMRRTHGDELRSAGSDGADQFLIQP